MFLNVQQFHTITTKQSKYSREHKGLEPHFEALVQGGPAVSKRFQKSRGAEKNFFFLIFQQTKKTKHKIKGLSKKILLYKQVQQFQSVFQNDRILFWNFHVPIQNIHTLFQTLHYLCIISCFVQICNPFFLFFRWIRFFVCFYF